jgi:hypothetical protein
VWFFAAFSFDFDLHKHKPKADGLNSLRKNPVIRHSERSEESLFSPATIQEGFLASLGMTELVHFFAACEICATGSGHWSERLLLKRAISKNL